WKICDALVGHRSGEQTGRHRRIDDHADAAAFAVRQDFLFDLAANQRVRRLKGSDGSDFFAALKLKNVVIGNADPADFSLFLERGHGAPGFFETGAVIFRRPVNLVQVDYIDLQATETVLAFLTNGLRRVDLCHLASF